MKKYQVKRMSKAEADQIMNSRNLNTKDEVAKAKVSTPEFKAFFAALPPQKKATTTKKVLPKKTTGRFTRRKAVLTTIAHGTSVELVPSKDGTVYVSTNVKLKSPKKVAVKSQH